MINKVFDYFNSRKQYVEQKLYLTTSLISFFPAKSVNDNTKGGISFQDQNNKVNITLIVITEGSQLGFILDATINLHEEFFHYRYCISNNDNLEQLLENIDKSLLFILSEYYSDSLILSKSKLPLMLDGLTTLKFLLQNYNLNHVKIKEYMNLFFKIKNKMLYSYKNEAEVILAENLGVFSLNL